MRAAGARARRRLVVPAITGLAVVACSQTAALAPVGGDRLAEVRFAALDVLTSQHVAVLTAPVCTASAPDDDEIACTGATVDAQPIKVVSHANQQDHMVITVGTGPIYDGPVQSVLNSGARPAP